MTRKLLASFCGHSVHTIQYHNKTDTSHITEPKSTGAKTKSKFGYWSSKLTVVSDWQVITSY